jgi:hypothetical protein
MSHDPAAKLHSGSPPVSRRILEPLSSNRYAYRVTNERKAFLLNSVNSASNIHSKPKAYRYFESPGPGEEPNSLKRQDSKFTYLPRRREYALKGYDSPSHYGKNYHHRFV